MALCPSHLQAAPASAPTVTPKLLCLRSLISAFPPLLAFYTVHRQVHCCLSWSLLAPSTCWFSSPVSGSSSSFIRLPRRVSGGSVSGALCSQAHSLWTASSTIRLQFTGDSCVPSPAQASLLNSHPHCMLLPLALHIPAPRGHEMQRDQTNCSVFATCLLLGDPHPGHYHPWQKHWDPLRALVWSSHTHTPYF